MQKIKRINLHSHYMKISLDSYVTTRVNESFLVKHLRVSTDSFHYINVECFAGRENLNHAAVLWPGYGKF